jgi:hypothetical protein
MLGRYCYPSGKSKSNGMFALKTNTPFGCDHQPSPFPPFTLSVPAQEITHDPMNSMVNYRSSLCFILQE